MKNIHLLPTEKPSRLTKPGGSSSIKLYTNGLTNTPKGHCKNYHLYITSDEEIKVDEYYLGEDNNIYCLVSSVNCNGKKIILTTDQDLIADGIQVIDDEFLEWFVKNPSCESVKVERLDTFKKTNEVYVDEIAGGNYYEIIKQYKTIIPQEDAILAKWDRLNKELEDALESAFGPEEPKQETRVFGTKDDKSFWGDKPKQDPTLENAKLALREYILTNKEKVTEDLQEMREKSGTGRDETLEEAAKRTYQKGLQDDVDLSFYDGVRLGAEWQSERMYSEEDLLSAFEAGMMFIGEDKGSFREWFEQFKKK